MLKFLKLFLMILTVVLVSNISCQASKIKIISPQDGSTVYTGQIVKIVVAATGLKEFVVFDEDSLPPTKPTSQPNVFALSIPPTQSPGPYQLTAFGNLDTTSKISIQVERSDQPSSIGISPEFLVFRNVGEQLIVSVDGNFVGQPSEPITKSSYTRLSVDRPDIIKLDPFWGLVTALSPGKAKIKAEYKGLTYTIPVEVP